MWIPFLNCVSNEQKKLCDDGERDINKYCTALTNVFNELSEEELKECENLAVEWNTKGLPDDVQRKWVIFILALNFLIISPQIVKNHSIGGIRLSEVH